MHRRRKRKRISDHAPDEHAACDGATEGLLIFLVLFTPWALGTSHPWAFWVANAAGYALGILWLAKVGIRKKDGFSPQRWGDPPPSKESTNPPSDDASPAPRPLSPTTRILAGVTVAFLGYILLGLINARGDFDEARNEFQTFAWSLAWLPHTEDRGATLRAFAQYLALACVFWSVRDWLMYRVAKDGKDAEPAPRAPDLTESIAIPYRLRKLLWIVALNAGALATAAILHRASESASVLWLFPQHPGREGQLAFGPWHYATHGGQYFNLVWPLGLAFWLWMHERAVRSVDARRARLDGPQLVLLPVTFVIGAAGLIADGSGATLVALLGGIAVILLTLALARREVSQFARLSLLSLMIVTGLSYFIVKWQHLVEQATLRDRRLRTELEIGSGDFTLLAKVRIPANPDGLSRTLLALSKDSEGDPRGSALIVGALPTGGLSVSMTGVSPDDANRLSLPNLPAAATNHEVTLTVVRQDGVRVYVNGTELAGTEYQTGTGPGWRSLIHSGYLAVNDPGVREVAFANFAFTRDEIAAGTRGPLVNLAEGIGTGPLSSKDLTLETNEFRLPPDISLTIAARPSTPNARWLTIRRTSPTGILALHRSLVELDPRLLSASSAVVKVWNPSDTPLHLAGSLREGRRSIVEIAPRAETVVTIPLIPGGGRGDATLDLAVTDAKGGDLINLPLGTQLFLHDLRLHSVRTVFASRIEDDMPLALLRDRVLGRGEVALNSRRMAADHGILGSGAGSFRSLYTRYRQPEQQPATAAGDDWRELRITLGWFGVLAAAVAVLTLARRTLVERGAPTLRLVLALLWLGPAACLLHARFDMPFQSYSIALLFAVVAAILSTTSIARRT